MKIEFLASAVVVSLLLPTSVVLADDTVSADNWKRIEELTGRKVNFKPANLAPITITGEVVDAWCYMSETMGPGRGPKHIRCAAACGNGGVPLGIVDDKNQIYIAAKSNKPYKGCKEQLMPFIGQRVTVKGFIARKGGCQVLRIEEVKRAK